LDFNNDTSTQMQLGGWNDPSYFLPGPSHQFTAAVRAYALHLRRAWFAKGAFISADKCDGVGRQWMLAFFALGFHQQCHSVLGS
jgi:hypothetical protein